MFFLFPTVFLTKSHGTLRVIRLHKSKVCVLFFVRSICWHLVKTVVCSWKVRNDTFVCGNTSTNRSRCTGTGVSRFVTFTGICRSICSLSSRVSALLTIVETFFLCVCTLWNALTSSQHFLHAERSLFFGYIRCSSSRWFLLLYLVSHIRNLLIFSPSLIRVK